MADITLLEDDSILFLEDIRDLYMPGSITEAGYIKISRRYTLHGHSASETLLEQYLYSGMDGNVSLDFRGVLKRLDDRYPDSVAGNSGETIFWQYREAEQPEEDDRTMTRVFLCSSDVKQKSNDIDYLAVPEDWVSEFVCFCPAGSPYELGVLQSGRYSIIESSEWSKDIVLRLELHIAEYPISRTEPFQFIITVRPSGEGEEDVVYRSPVCEIFRGDFQLFAFADRYCGFTHMPMRGVLEMEPEYKFENAKYSSGYGKVSGSGSVVMRQYTGGITRKTAEVLSDLLLSDRIFHKVGNYWKKIVIEEADVMSDTSSSLHFGSFSFRYENPDSIF